MSRLVTLKKNDPALASYLWGNFSDDERALAVLSLNTNQQPDSFTFEIVKKETIVQPPFWSRLSTTFRIPLLFLSIIPLLAVFAMLKAQTYIEPLEMVLCFFGVSKNNNLPVPISN